MAEAEKVESARMNPFLHSKSVFFLAVRLLEDQKQCCLGGSQRSGLQQKSQRKMHVSEAIFSDAQTAGMKLPFSSRKVVPGYHGRLQTPLE